MMPLWIHNLLSTLSFLLTLVFVSSILRARRASGSTLAWLLLICIIPYFGIPFYLLLSGRKFKTRLAKKAKIYQIAKSLAAQKNLSTTEKILRASGVAGVKNNQQIQLLETGETAYKKLLELIRGAQKSIHITTFIFGNDPVGRSIVEELTARALAGLEVRVLVDSLGATLIRHPSFTDFKRAGGKIAYFMPVLHLPFKGRSNLRNHRKLMVVDTKFAILGGMNLAQEYLGPKKDVQRWVDLALYLDGDCVGDIEDVFLKDWAFASDEKNALAPLAHSKSTSGRFLAQVVASGPDAASDPLYDVLLSSINDAKDSIWIASPYFIPDESLTKALELAVKRGVAVRLLIPRHSNHRLADLARGSFIRQLKAIGANILFFPRMIHAKVFLVDHSIAILGSANFDMRSLLLNYELGVAIYSQVVLIEVERWLEEKKSEASESLPQAGFFREIAEGVGRVIGPIL